MSKDIQEAIEGEKQRLRCIHLADRSGDNLCDAIKRVEQLEKENTRLKVKLKVTAHGLDKEKQDCFYEDGHTNKCLGYSFFKDDEPCEYCKTCERLSIKEDD